MSIRFAAIGINHYHIHGQVDCLHQAGAELVAFHGPEDDLAKPFAEGYPQAPRVADKRRFLEDRSPHVPGRRCASRLPAD
jgi:predicted dehydrogenase